MLMDDETKDDEERRLESLLFGVKYVPKGKGKMESGSDTEDEGSGDDDDDGARGMQHLLDQDVRIFLLSNYNSYLFSPSFSSSMKVSTRPQLLTLSRLHLNLARTVQKVHRTNLVLVLIPTNPLRQHRLNGRHPKNPL